MSHPVLQPLLGGQTDWRALGLGPLPRSSAPRTPPPAEPSRGETLADARRRQLRDALGMAAGAEGVRVRTPDSLDDVVVTARFIDHVVDHDQPRERFASFVLPTLRDPAEVWLQANLNERLGRIEYSRVFVGAYDDRGIAAVVQERRYGLTPWTFFPIDRIDSVRTGYLLYRRR